MKHLFENHDLATERCGQFIDITDDVLTAVSKSEVENGTVVVYSPHTTCAVVINEPESGFMDDFCELLDELAPAGRYYRHDDLAIRTEGIEEDTADYPNGHSHLRAALLSLDVAGDPDRRRAADARPLAEDLLLRARPRPAPQGLHPGLGGLMAGSGLAVAAAAAASPSGIPAPRRSCQGRARELPGRARGSCRRRPPAARGDLRLRAARRRRRRHLRG